MMLCAFCVTQASALEYTFDAPEDYLFGQPTSDDTIYEWENPNVDRSKNTALVAPGFGTPTSYLPGSGEYLTPNLVPGALSGGLVNQVGSANINGGTAGSSVIPGQYPSVSGNVTMTQIPGGNPTDIAQGNTTGGYTEVTDDLYYSNGSLGTLKIPAINLTVKVYQGTDSAALKKGAGHFTNTSMSCWCCKNKNRKELKAIYQFLPQYWERLKGLQAQIPMPMKPYSRKGVPYGNVFDLEKVFEREIRAEKDGGSPKGKRRRHEQSR